MKILKMMPQMEEIGPLDAWLRLPVVGRGKRNCAVCGRVIEPPETTFYAGFQIGRANLFFHASCFTEEDRLAAKSGCKDGRVQQSNRQEGTENVGSRAGGTDEMLRIKVERIVEVGPVDSLVQIPLGGCRSGVGMCTVCGKAILPVADRTFFEGYHKGVMQFKAHDYCIPESDLAGRFTRELMFGKGNHR